MRLLYASTYSCRSENEFAPVAVKTPVRLNTTSTTAIWPVCPGTFNVVRSAETVSATPAGKRTEVTYPVLSFADAFSTPIRLCPVPDADRPPLENSAAAEAL